MKIIRFVSGYSNFVLVFILTLMTTISVHAAEPVGVAITVKGIVAVTPKQGEAYFLEKNSSLYEGDIISSAKKSFVVLNFIDNSKVVVRQNSVFVIEGFSDESGQEDSTLDLVKGGIRAVTGLIAKKNPENYQLKTSVASLGVRGTNYDALLCEEACVDENNGEVLQPSVEDSECEIRLNLNTFPPGGYFKVREGIVVLTKGNQSITLKPGDVGFADERRIGCLPQVPAFLDDSDGLLPDLDDFRSFSALQCTP